MIFTYPQFRLIGLSCLPLVLASCVLKPYEFDDRPLRGALDHDQAPSQLGETGPAGQPKPTEQAQPQLSALQPRGLLSQGDSGLALNEGEINGVFESVPLPEFINKVLGELLAIDFVLDPSLKRSRDLVTLRVNEPLPSKDFLVLVEQVLDQYGISINNKDNVAFVSPAKKGPSNAIPLIISGSALPEVPSSHRPVFQLVPVETVSAASLLNPIKQVVPQSGLKLSTEGRRNAILMRGPSELVNAATNVVQALDHPWFSGKNLQSYSPDNIGATELAKAVADLLQAEGVDARTGTGGAAINLMAQERFGRVYVFGNSAGLVEHAIQWANKLDADAWQSVEEGIFTYAVKNQPAADVAQLAEQLHTGTAANNQAANNSTARVTSFVVDSNQNMVMFRGSGEDWNRMLPILKQIDQPSPSVLVEILIAEVTLSDDSGLGVEWFANSTVNGDYDANFGTLGGLGVGGTAFSLSLNSAGAARALLNTFLQNQKATIRSSPRIMVKSGESANINVGNQIPVLTSRLAANSQSNGNSDIVQQVEYRNTGVDLSVTPTVQGSGLVDLQIAQSLSEVQGTASGISPTILNRQVNTTLTLQDGGSVLIGGLISTSRTENSAAVPWFARIPFLGWLFKNRSESQQKTELLLMVVPYVIRNNEQAQELTEAFKSRLSSEEIHEKPNK